VSEKKEIKMVKEIETEKDTYRARYGERDRKKDS
jgi:hypothetical protein